MFEVEVKTSGGIKTVPIETRLMAERRVFLEGQLSCEAAGWLLKKLLYLITESKKEPIDLYLNITGGEAAGVLLACDAVRMCTVPVRMTCIGKACGAGAYLLACGGTGNRYVLPSAVLRLRECDMPDDADRVGFNEVSTQPSASLIRHTKAQLNRMLSECTGRTETEIAEAVSRERYFDAQEAIAFGLCDKIADTF